MHTQVDVVQQRSGAQYPSVWCPQRGDSESVTYEGITALHSFDSNRVQVGRTANEQMNGWVGEQLDGRGCMGRWVGGCMIGRMGGWVSGWVSEWAGGWVGGCMMGA